ncbi:Formylglycine-generating enzyme, required for sulfatase activity, contains SUMF1/FGE domain [Fodinibius roseus]|uniref:Formylglycine-generating enzyme, required for sulfatase activity, contains SUMF1/FGE domain n=1 Tax=Fodinibius roseus TaxID=1194090 RepID=A0A1M5K302_9BACT|nr:SUMF1/EgtB/PvdO family nonheme iron enzyme [Fodinibius roseus]SHG46929.1 Formylglycine-generating enzyme, required for sulfatase activity, contains SUMF1/FGE domain [Fodinibius roseus]
MKYRCLLLFISFIIGTAIQAEGQDFAPYEEQIPESDQQIEMVPVEGGTFLMGSPEDEPGREEDEGPRHKVTVDNFWMGKYEITWDQYDLFVEEKIEDVTAAGGGEVDIKADAVSLPTPPYIDMSFGMGRDGYPAINMTQYAAVMYAKWLTAETGHFYRLPTEAEWEYACRAGNNSTYTFGDDPGKLDKYAWYEENSEGGYQKIGNKEPNALGLFDIHGNVAEWTMDQYDPDYYEQFKGETADNPWHKPDELYPRSLRGGSWQDEPVKLRCAERRGSQAKWKQHDPQLPKSLWWLTNAPFVGFRLVRPESPPPQEKIEEYWLEAMEDY